MVNLGNIFYDPATGLCTIEADALREAGRTVGAMKRSLENSGFTIVKYGMIGDQYHLTFRGKN